MANLMNAINTLTTDRQERMVEIIEILSFAKMNDQLTTEIGRQMDQEKQRAALQTAQELFNELKGSYTSAFPSASGKPAQQSQPLGAVVQEKNDNSPE